MSDDWVYREAGTPGTKPPITPSAELEAKQIAEAAAREPVHQLVTDLLPSDDWAHRFFTAYLGPEGRATISHSCRAAGIDQKTYRKRLADDEIFRHLQNEANHVWADAVEYELHNRVLHGTERPQFQKGALVGYIREVDNRLLQWYLERLMPEKYHLATKFELDAGHGTGAFKFQMGERALEIEAGEAQED